MARDDLEEFGRYTLLDRIASGGMAEIFKARYEPGPDFSKIVVIKRILPSLADDDEFVTMFRDEARITVQLSHTNIVHVFDFGKIAGSYFLAMEYVHGQNLGAVLRRSQSTDLVLPPELAVYIASEVAKGLHYAHTRVDPTTGAPLDIVHRDVSPSNILVSYQGEVKITDFGIAKAASRIAGTQKGIVKGKIAYMAPEQILKGTVDGRADVFALGVLLWEALSGKKLFPKDHVEAMRTIGFDQPEIPPPSTHNPSVPHAVDDVVLKALSWDRKVRGDADELHDALRSVVWQNVGHTELATFMRDAFERELVLGLDVARAMGVVEPGTLNDIQASAEAGATRMEQLKRLEKGRSGDENTLTAPVGSILAQTRRRSRLRALFLVLGGAALAGFFGALVSQQFGEPETPTPTVVQTRPATPTSTPPSSPVSTATTPIPATQTPHRTPKPTPVPTKVRPATYGYLSLESTPTWAHIYVDGKKIGKATPSFNIKLRTGTRRIRLVNPEAHVEARLTVQITEGVSIGRRVELKASPQVPR